MKIRHIDTDAPVSVEHQQLGLPPLEEEITHPGAHPFRRDLILLMGLPFGVLTLIGIATLLLPSTFKPLLDQLTDGLVGGSFWTAALVGLFAQVVDGALGMAYGITATTFLLSSGVSPAAATASVHLAEVFTTAFSAFSHWKFGNINKALFKRLLIPGIIGAVIGAYVITSVDGSVIKPYIAAYLLLMGLYVLSKAFRKLKQRKEPPKHVAGLALTGGFVDAIGGGGWGPVVTTSLIGSGQDPRQTIGSVNAAEFFLTIVGGAAFAILGGFTHWTVIAGLIVGGLFAAPFAAWLCSKLSARVLLVVVGLLISALSILNLYKALA
ncbi:MAG TPA: sulfite exporter TauE/SafE family protein [Pseudomonadales bacterium]|nr:sulfite exporter TauE/SafE family protein [Pseudomonadales bacterium]